MDIDRTDRRILEALQANAALSNAELAARVGLSPAPCWRRVRRLEAAGVIARRVALLEPAALGLSVTAYANVSLENHHPDTVRQFDELIRDCPQVLECCSMSGSHDYLLKVVARDMSEYEAFLSGTLLPIPAVQSVNTSFVLKRKKYTTALPVTAPAGSGEAASAGSGTQRRARRR
ncbi:MAG TPA: Lrp/AsnC family transcriptional regulator [Steroidobacteraceae bacterium]|nr:Lrp/AsnC family transcriptional regulator [Steroidobacteraceae bacterium]